MAERNHQTLSNGGNMKLLIIQVIKCLIKHEPEARDLLDQVNPPDEPNDSLDDI
jgi:hypothetical protein